MRRKSLAMLFVAMLIIPTLLLLVPTAAATVVGCDVDPKSGPVFSPVTVTGQVSPTTPNRAIDIYWSPTPIPPLTPIATTTSAAGIFTATFNVPASPAGEYYVIALDKKDGGYCFDSFEVTPKVELRSACGCPAICVQPSEDVSVVGTGFGADMDVEWEAWGSGPTLASGTAHTDGTGSWFAEFHVPEAPGGEYVLEAIDEDGNKAKAEFMVGPVLLLCPHDGQPGDEIAVKGCLPGVEEGTTVKIYFEIPPVVRSGPAGECCLLERILVGETETTRCGYFEGTITVPELPTLGPHTYTVTAEADSVSAESWFRIHACITIDQSTAYVGDTVTIQGHGFAQDANVTVWMSGLLPEDVPYEAIVSLCDLVDLVSAWDHTNTWHIVTVGLFLPVTYATTDCLGYFEAEFEVPECWGGYHLIVGTCECLIAPPPHPSCWVANIEHGEWDICYDCLVGPYLCMSECAKVVNKPILRVLPKIWTDPACGVSGQTITLYGTGLSAFEFYIKYTDINFNQWPDLLEFCIGEGEILAYLRCSGFVLDFGPNKRWIDGPYFPNMGEMLPCDLWYKLHLGHYVLNGQYDEAWGRASGTDWNSYSPLMLNPRGTLVSDGMSFAITLGVDYLEDVPGDFCDRFSVTLDFAWEYRQVGCPFLTVPWLQPQTCELTAYRFDYIEVDFKAQWPGQDVVDASLEFFTYDYDETDTTDFTIECLRVDAGECPPCPECPEVDLSEIEDRLAALEGDLDALMEQLSALDAKITGLITDAEGNIIAKIDTSVGTITAKLSDLDAKIVSLDESVVTVQTALGQVQASLDDLHAYVTVDLTNRLATIETDLGTIEGRLVTMEGKMATIETDVGKITTKADLIVNHTGSMPVTIALSLIAAISAIAAAVLILRKVYIA